MTVSEIIEFENSDKPREVIKKLVKNYEKTANITLESIKQELGETKKEVEK